MSRAKEAAGQLQRTAGSVNKQLQKTTNNIFPPQQREQKINELRASSHRNPKLAVGHATAQTCLKLTRQQLFLAVQAVVLGVPILLFLGFAISTLLISLATCLLIAITTALIYTAFAVGFALFFLVPTLFTVSFAATCFFLWGLFIYLILQRFNIAQAPVKRITNYGNSWNMDGANGNLDATKKPKVILRTNGVIRSYSAEDMESTGPDADMTGNQWESKWKHGAQQVHNEFAKQLDTRVDTVVGLFIANARSTNTSVQDVDPSNKTS